MEGRIARGQEQFSDFLISLVHGFSAVAENCAKALELYIALSYGDETKDRAIPYELARLHGIFSGEVALLADESDKKTREERQKFQETYIADKERDGVYWRKKHKQQKRRDERERNQL